MDLFTPTAAVDAASDAAMQMLQAEGWRNLCVTGAAATIASIGRHTMFGAMAVETPWLNLASDDRSRYDLSLAEVQEAMRVADDTGARWISVSPGYAVYGGLDGQGQPDSEPVNGDKARLRLLRALDRLANDADNHRVMLVIQQQAALGREEMLVRGDEAAQLLATLGTSHVRLGLDLGHIKITARQRKLDPDGLVEEALPSAGLVWLHGNEGSTDSHERPKSSSWELSQVERPQIRQLPLVYGARHQSLTDLRSFVMHLCDGGHYSA